MHFITSLQNMNRTLTEEKKNKPVKIVECIDRVTAITICNELHFYSLLLHIANRNILRVLHLFFTKYKKFQEVKDKAVDFTEILL